MTPDVTAQDARRMLRGACYLAALRLQRLESAWPEEPRTTFKQAAVDQARRALAEVELRAREENIEP